MNVVSMSLIEEFLGNITRDISNWLDGTADMFNMFSEGINWPLVYGVIAGILAVVFHEKKRHRLTMVSFWIAMFFLSIAAIRMWVRIGGVVFAPVI